jgi:23S rRNA (cytosine1962-C5)-methyltransferase
MTAAREMEGLPSYVEAATGPLRRLSAVIEDGLEFQAPLAEGQKTGWFFDQAANRRSPCQVHSRSAGAGCIQLRRRLGGACGARRRGEVLCVDSSAAALELAVGNAERNGSTIIAVRKGDAFDVLEDLAKKRSRFDVVIVDPPAFAKRKKDLPKALAAYKRLNQLAMQIINDDGILVSCSCSPSCEPRGFAGRHCQSGKGSGQARADLGGGRPGAGSPGASRDSRDTLSKSLFLSGE